MGGAVRVKNKIHHEVYLGTMRYLMVSPRDDEIQMWGALSELKIKFTTTRYKSGGGGVFKKEFTARTKRGSRGLETKKTKNSPRDFRFFCH